MTNCFVTFLFICQIYVSYEKPLNRGPKGKHISGGNILEPEVSLEMRQDYLQNKINTLYLEPLLVDSLIENQNSKRNATKKTIVQEVGWASRRPPVTVNKKTVQKTRQSRRSCPISQGGLSCAEMTNFCQERICNFLTTL